MSPRPQAVATVLIDEPYVRVTEWRFAPDAETGWHVHGHDYVVIPMLDGALLLEEPGGDSRTVPMRAHAPYTRRAGVEHNVVNASGHAYAFLEVELLSATRSEP
jgi:mannose-6-phosphate isomerase-like protein (cupin superfamily)